MDRRERIRRLSLVFVFGVRVLLSWCASVVSCLSERPCCCRHVPRKERKETPIPSHPIPSHTNTHTHCHTHCHTHTLSHTHTVTQARPEHLPTPVPLSWPVNRSGGTPPFPPTQISFPEAASAAPRAFSRHGRPQQPPPHDFKAPYGAQWQQQQCTPHHPL